MAWWYNTESGALTSAGSIQSFFQTIQGDVGLGAGWHHLKIADNATGAQAAAEAKKEFPNGAPPTTNVGQQVSQEAQQIATGSPTGFSGLGSGLAKIGDFFNRLTQKNTWLRVAELAVGVILLTAGLNALLKQSTGVDVAGTAVKTAKAVR